MMMSTVAEAAQCLQQGKVLAYPTEAVWGLGCDPYNQQAFSQILRLKQRPIEKGVILLAGHISQVEHLLDLLSTDCKMQVMQSWNHNQSNERATTWLLPATADIPFWIKGNHPKVAVRVSNHPLCIELCQAFGGFIVSTSANPSNLAPATSLQQAKQYFAAQLHYLDGALGTCQQPSKIIDAQTGEVIRD